MKEELRNKLEKVRIKTSNLAEKVAAHYFLHGKFGTELPNSMSCSMSLYVGMYPGKKNTDSWNNKGHKHIIDFKDLHKFDELLESFELPEKVVLNENYTAVVTKDGITVGCQTFPLSIAEELKKAVDKVTK